jgi:hypothetical protein
MEYPKIVELKGHLDTLHKIKLIETPVDMVGKQPEQLKSIFMDLIDEIDREGSLDDVPESMLDFYNSLLGD